MSTTNATSVKTSQTISTVTTNRAATPTCTARPRPSFLSALLRTLSAFAV